MTVSFSKDLLAGLKARPHKAQGFSRLQPASALCGCRTVRGLKGRPQILSP